MVESAFLAGLLIGIGDIALVSCDNKYVGALLFSLALLSIIKLKLPLYTGKVGRMIKDKTVVECFVYLVFNIVGAMFVLLWLMPYNYTEVHNISTVKFLKDIPQLFLAGFLCNVLIHLAVTVKNDVITVLCVMVFILCGFEHCIADVPFIICSGRFFGDGVILFLTILVGNTIGGLVTEALISNESKDSEFF
ncbi:formate/nitrite transporter family protein [bacterium]|nr:formate/nitrite transporter family protein [bacterium]